MIGRFVQVVAVERPDLNGFLLLCGVGIAAPAVGVEEETEWESERSGNWRSR